MKKLFTPKNVHRLLVLVICNMATTVQGFLATHNFQWRAIVTGTLAAGLSAGLGWFIGNLSDGEPSAASGTPQ